MPLAMVSPEYRAQRIEAAARTLVSDAVDSVLEDGICGGNTVAVRLDLVRALSAALAEGS